MRNPVRSVRRPWGVEMLLLPLLLSAGSAAAQPFEYVYGPPASADQSGRRATPVRACPGGGFVAAGTTSTPGAAPNVYVVRTDASGAPLWELVYDVGPGGNDRGQALAEAADGSGFIVVGTTNLGVATSDDVLLLKIDCNGRPLWAFTYFSTLPEAAFDIVEARTGDAAFGTSRGDLLVAGYAANPAGNRDAMLLRTRANGTLIWNRRYDVAGSSEMFRGLTEARPLGATTTGDVVGAGVFFRTTTPFQGFAARVNGNTGLLGAAPHGAAIYGGPDSESFESVIELRAAPNTGSLVMIGNTSSTARGSDLYLVRTTPFPPVVVTQRRIGDLPGSLFGEEAAFDGREVSNVLALAAPGQLALTGRVGRSGTTESDAFLLVANPSTLQPNAGAGRLFGDHGPGREVGVSVADHATGFFIGGSSDSNFEGLIPADPRDMYLLDADTGGKTSCETVWAPRDAWPNFPVERVNPVAVPFLQSVPRQVRVVRVDTAYRNCP